MLAFFINNCSIIWRHEEMCSEEYSEPFETSKKLFTKIVNDL